MSHLNFPNAQAYSITTFQSVGSTTFSVVANIKNQIGVAIYTGTSGIELAGVGASYGAAGTAVTLLYGVTTFMKFVNSNGSSIVLASNTNGLPIFNTILEPMSIFTGAPVWLSARAAGLTITVAYATSDAFGNQ